MSETNDSHRTSEDTGKNRQSNNSSPVAGQGSETRDSGYKNIETSVNNPDYFNDDYAVGQEDEMGNEEAKTEKEERIGEGRRQKS